MSLDTEKNFEADIESWLISDDGGWTKATDDGYRASVDKALDINTLVDFVKRTQPKNWERFVKQSGGDPVQRFYKCYEDAVQLNGPLHVLRHGFKDKGNPLRVCYFRPESTLNDQLTALYRQNTCQCIRQWHYSEKNGNSVDMMLAVNGIPIVAIELKNQLTGQDIRNGEYQWRNDRDPKEPCFRFNHRVLLFMAMDLYDCSMTTKLEGDFPTVQPRLQRGGKRRWEGQSAGGRRLRHVVCLEERLAEGFADGHPAEVLQLCREGQG